MYCSYASFISVRYVWKCFSFTLGSGVSVGVCYTFSVCVNIALVSFDFSVHVFYVTSTTLLVVACVDDVRNALMGLLAPISLSVQGL